ncbi:phosphatase PAP2 family protein [Pseudomonas rubra]|uniref:Phosphatase PAP2 family protein n=1 Tax=Pseudomonas rubra TaxID=2942627 RepID=A0ABT5PB18_9PSED|nr:phosphatase PAP2 family protein [Pseudomonas rubra]MDD1015506.1 phosphatase PAP2 family protein [Pseudomonas rubra]MDD1041652.1 phosphatase PAP2 family protein [Pseudomonas rubra]MDD1157104.1 phosphatase PAP2 family protein [Pseudomonas rubra]
MQAPSRRAFYMNNLGLPLLLAALVFLMFDLTNLDRLISNLLLDPLSGQFPLLHNQWFEKVTHKWPRILPNWTGEMAVIGLLLSFIWPRFAAYPQAMPSRTLEKWRIAPALRFTTRYRRDLLFVVVAFTLCTTVIHYLKSHTSVYCPVETTLYGGAQLHQEWFENFTWLDKAGAGRCWPGGHASSGFTLLAVYFVALRHRWAHARKLLVAVLVLGLVYGTARVLQGWHYMSHTFWAGIFVWLTTWLTALFFYGRLALQAPARARTRQRPQPLVNATQASLRPE